MSSGRSEMSTSFFLMIKLNEPIIVSGRRLGQIIDLTSNTNFIVLGAWNSMCKCKLAGQKLIVFNC